MAKQIIIAVFALTAFFQTPASGITGEGSQGSSGQVIAYYFHGSFRCPTCRDLEEYAKEAVQNNFKDELEKGKLVFKAVNIEKEGNERFVSDYRLYSKSLVLSLVKDGEEVRYENLSKIWEYVRDKEKYMNYVKDAIDTFLEEIQ